MSDEAKTVTVNTENNADISEKTTTSILSKDNAMDEVDDAKEMTTENEENCDDSEEEFIQSLENKNDEERQKWEAEHQSLPQAQEDAPTLLRAALGKQEEHEEEEKKADVEEKEQTDSEVKTEGGEDGNEKAANQVNQRVSYKNR